MGWRQGVWAMTVFFLRLTQTAQKSGITVKSMVCWSKTELVSWQHCADCLYRWLGYACWQWCLWPRWWLHTPILHGPPCWGTETVSCHWVGCCAYSCLASPPSVHTEMTAVKRCEHIFQHIASAEDNLFVICWCAAPFSRWWLVYQGLQKQHRG